MDHPPPLVDQTPLYKIANELLFFEVLMSIEFKRLLRVIFGKA